MSDGLGGLNHNGRMNAARSALDERLADRQVILIDGGTGTELERNGVPMRQDAWCSGGALTHPDTVLAVHARYIRAGAEVIIANTYACSRHLLERAGVGAEFEVLNRVGVELARAARHASGANSVVVAGSISTTAQGGPQPPLDVARVNYADQARIQADAGAELLVLEIMRDVEHTRAALDAAVATGLPVWVGFAASIVNGEPVLYDEQTSLADGLLAIKDAPVELVAVMHTEAADVDACLDVVDGIWSGPMGVYSQTGSWVRPHWQFHDTITPEEYGQRCLGWVERGVQVIGGCCGIGPEHIEHLQTILPKRVPAR